MKDKLFLLCGTYTGGKSVGIYIYGFDDAEGQAVPIGVTPAENPSFLALSKAGNLIYSVSENENSKLTSFILDHNAGTLTPAATRETGDDGACHIAVDPTGRFAVVSNYGTGSISVFEIGQQGQISGPQKIIQFEGRGPDPDRQEHAHTHCAMFSPDGRYLLVTDLGTDSIYRFEPDYSGSGDFITPESMVTFSLSPGCGPRHIIFSNDGNYLYLVTELTSEVMVFSYGGGELEHIQTVPVAELTEDGGAELILSPDGRFLYVSKRKGHDGISIFHVDFSDGTIHKTAHTPTGRHPRHISMSADGRYVAAACKDGGTVEIYRRNHTTGELEETANKITLDQPVFAMFVEGIPEMTPDND